MAVKVDQAPPGPATIVEKAPGTGGLPWWSYALLFLVAFLPRVLDLERPLTFDEPKWLARSRDFVGAFGRGDWDSLPQVYHPGVTTMWLGGLAQVGVELGRPPGASLPDLGNPAANLWYTPAKFPTVAVTSLTVVLFAFYVSKLFSGGVALVAALLLALDPFFLGHSRLIHTDALLTSFMMLSVLPWLLFLRSGQRRFLVASALSGGLALLTKLPALFLFPFLALTLIWAGERSWWERGRWLLLWLGIALGVVMALWPLVWVNPARALWLLSQGAVAGATPHDPATSYAFEPLYYLQAVLFHTTPSTLGFSALAALAVLWALLSGKAKTSPWREAAVVLAYAGLFAVVMSLAAKRGDRYLLPAFPVIDLLAALAVVWLTRWLSSLIPGQRWLAAVVPLAALGLHLLPLGLHPFYLAHYNPLLPRPEAQQMGWGEGLELAAAYLNQKPRAQGLKVASWYPEVFARFFRGETYSLSHWDERDTDYVVLYKGMLDRSAEHEATQLLQQLRGRSPPEQTIYLNGLEYAWIYRVSGGGS